MRMNQLVFDIGGTQLRAAVYDGTTGSLSEVRVTDAPSFVRHPDLAWPELRAELVRAMSRLRSQLGADPIASAVVAFPGPVDAARCVLAAPTLWGTLGTYPHSLEADLSSAWPGVKVRVLNDVSAAGYRYMRDPGDDFCVVTVSTGVGNKVFVGGRPLIGPTAAGGEIGHLRVDAAPSAPLCDCGGRGHLGALSSGRGLVRVAREHAARAPEAFGRSALAREMGLDPAGLTAEALAVAYGHGDPWARMLVGRGAKALGSAIAAIHMAVGTERFVLIGGFALGLGAAFRDEVQEAACASCWQGGAGAVAVVFGETDGRCALVGAGRAGCVLGDPNDPV